MGTGRWEKSMKVWWSWWGWGCEIYSPPIGEGWSTREPMDIARVGWWLKCWVRLGWCCCGIVGRTMLGVVGFE